MSNFLQLTHEALQLSDITRLTQSPDCGAISIFIGVLINQFKWICDQIDNFILKGTTRNNWNNKTVLKLEYEAYESMALKEMQKICDAIREKWASIKHIAIYHRLGSVPVEESSVIIGLSINVPYFDQIWFMLLI